MAGTPPVPARIAAVWARYPGAMRGRFQTLRGLIYTVAAETEGVGPLTETLKWGQPAYLTEASRSGTTIRLGTVKSAPAACAVLVSCQTTLIESFRAQFAGDLAFDGNRAMVLVPDRGLPVGALRLCLLSALTYHAAKRASR
ncbi:MAG: DUF1801 domain-containing protein [Rhodobacteraceae bacterium]|nr:DUF1801 domain-containing protein [Paracoccaceae bacterium]